MSDDTRDATWIEEGPSLDIMALDDAGREACLILGLMEDISTLQYRHMANRATLRTMANHGFGRPAARELFLGFAFDFNTRFGPEYQPSMWRFMKLSADVLLDEIYGGHR